MKQTTAFPTSDLLELATERENWRYTHGMTRASCTTQKSNDNLSLQAKAASAVISNGTTCLTKT